MSDSSPNKDESFEGLLTERQLLVWNYIKQRKIVTPKQVRETLQLHMQTTFQILDKLLKMNRLRKLGGGRDTKYLIHPLV